MIVLSEYKLTQEEIKTYHDKGYRVAYIYQSPVIAPKESVGFLLETLYTSTINLIETLLFKGHRVTLKFEDKTYTLNHLDEWKYTYQSDSDQLKQKTYKHYVYQIYLDKRNEYFERKKASKLKEQYQIIYENFNNDLPNDIELDLFIKTFAYLYQVDVDYSDRLSKLIIYHQLKYYLEHDIPYVNEPHSIDIEDEPMFKPSMFKIPPYEEPIEEISFGNLNYFEDFIYKNTETSCII